jgi:hypothetical protein
MNKVPTKLDPKTIWAEAFPIYFSICGRLRKFTFHLSCDDELHGLVSPADIRAWQRKMTRKSYVTAWSKTHKKKTSEASRLAAKLKRCGVAR